jgi:hypothetical protein
MADTAPTDQLQQEFGSFTIKPMQAKYKIVPVPSLEGLYV